TPIALAEPSSLFRPSLIVDTVSSATPSCARFSKPHSKVLHFILEPSISSKRNRKIQRDYDQDLYKIRHLVENAFLYLKQWRGIATRYLKNTKSFLAAVHIRYIIMWAKIS
ncbi:MAG: hypothetical protein ACK6BL_00155, partial [Holosporaceae bacterium]